MAVAGGESERIHPDRAAAVRGAYLSGESYAELAERHSVPLNTMRTWLPPLLHSVGATDRNQQR
jgi:RNA polymerase sigma-70 factor (ECF subfamily)